MTISNNIINYSSYAIKKPENIVQKGITLSKPENLPTQISKATVKEGRTFKFTESENSKGFESMRKSLHQRMLREALLSKAAIISKSHETKGARTESAK